MQKHWDNFLFGLFFGLGFSVVGALIRFIVALFSGAHAP